MTPNARSDTVTGQLNEIYSPVPPIEGLYSSRETGEPMRVKRLWLFLAAVPLVSGCAVGYTQVMKSPETRLGNYQFLAIPDLVGSSQVPDGVKRGIPDTVANQAREKKLFSKIERGHGLWAPDKTLVVQGQVVQFSPGSQGMRWMTAGLWGVGRGSVIVNIKFVDLAANKVLPESNFEGEIKGGPFGGGMDEDLALLGPARRGSNVGRGVEGVNLVGLSVDGAHQLFERGGLQGSFAEQDLGAVGTEQTAGERQSQHNCPYGAELEANVHAGHAIR